MEKNDELIIKCPHCGAEYLPCEIFYPDELLGNCSNVVRDDSGKIIYHEGNMNLEEEYTCDWCNKTFKARMIPTFKTEKQEIDFDDGFLEDIK